MDATNTRASLDERIARANAARKNGEWESPNKQLVEAERRAAFDVCDVYRDHADELLSVTGRLSAVLPSRAAYFARTEPRAAAHLDNRSAKAYAQVENPACVFVWELRHNKEGALATLPDEAYAEVLDATDRLKDLWEDEPWQSDLQLAKTLIVQIVLRDDDLRAEVLRRADAMAKECACAIAPYLHG